VCIPARETHYHHHPKISQVNETGALGRNTELANGLGFARAIANTLTQLRLEQITICRIRRWQPPQNNSAARGNPSASLVLCLFRQRRLAPSASCASREFARSVGKYREQERVWEFDWFGILPRGGE
jgi:hypothetical protein